MNHFSDKRLKLHLPLSPKGTVNGYMVNGNTVVGKHSNVTLYFCGIKILYSAVSGRPTTLS